MTPSENSKSGTVIAAVITGVFLVIVALITGAFQIITTNIENEPIVVTFTPISTESIQPSQEPQITNSPTIIPNLLPTQIADTPTVLTERIFVSATAAPSYVYVPTTTGSYVFQYESGAYSTQPTDDSVLPNFSWHTAVRFFREIKNWRDDQTTMGIASPDWSIDTGTPFRYRESEALSDAQSAMNTGQMSVVIYLEQDIPIYLQIASTSPENNRGGVWLSVTLQQ